MNHATLSVLFGIAFSAAPASPGGLCVLAAFSINVCSLNIYNLYVVVTKFPIAFRVLLNFFYYLHCYQSAVSQSISFF